MLEIGVAEICPPTECVSAEMQAYRFTYGLISDKKNFEPVFVKNPRRFNDKADAEKCSSFGISLYKSEEQAITKYFILKNLIKNIGKTIGTHLAEGWINETHGVVTPIDEEGHFDLHEFEECDLHQDFKILKEII